MQKKNNHPKGKNRHHRFVFRRIIGPIPVDFWSETPVRNPILHAFSEDMKARLERLEKRLDAIGSRLDDIKKSLCYNKETMTKETVETKRPSQAEVEAKVDILVDRLIKEGLYARCGLAEDPSGLEQPLLDDYDCAVLYYTRYNRMKLELMGLSYSVDDYYLIVKPQ